MSAELAALEALMAALRRGGATHWDGWVPGWPKENACKFVLAPEPAAARNPEEPTAPVPRRPTPLTDDELDAAALRHVRIHGQPPKES